MKVELPKSFKQGSTSIVVLKRSGDTALARTSVGTGQSYEVAKIQLRTKGGVEEEQWPNASQWGTHGWTATTRERAESLFEEVLRFGSPIYQNHRNR